MAIGGPSARPQTLTLTERVATDCRLTGADVEYLRAEHRDHVELALTGRRGRYRVTPLGHVGTIVCPSCRLSLRPKIPVKDLFYLLDPTEMFPVIEDAITEKSGSKLLDFLAWRLARLLADRARAGLHRAYAERTEPGRYLRGQLDVAAQLRDPNGRRDQVHCRYEEFTADVPCNQVPKATAERVLRSPLLGDNIRATLCQALGAFADVQSVPLHADSFTTAEADRQTGAYRPLLDLCRLLAGGLDSADAAGPTPYPSFLLDMERVFERYVTAGVERAFAGSRFTVAVQPLFRVNRPAAGLPAIEMRPDLLIEQAGRPVLVLDVKWKRRKGSPLVREDLYQVLAYCTALGVHRAVLVYPGRRDREGKYELASGPMRVAIRTLRVTGSREDCQRSLQKLGRAVRLFGRS